MPQQKSLNEQLPLDDKTLLYPWLRRLLAILEPRFGSLEADKANLDTAIALVREVALFRINEVLLPSVERIQALTSLGFLVAHSGSAVALSPVRKTFVIDEGTERDLFTPSPFVSIEAVDEIETYAVAKVFDYNNSTGALTVDILSVHGSTDIKTAWVVSSSAGVSESVRQYASDAAASAASAIAARDTTTAARDVTLAARDSTAAARDAAFGARDAAAASAAAAATYDPAVKYDKTGGTLTGDVIVEKDQAAFWTSQLTGAMAGAKWRIFQGSADGSLNFQTWQDATAIAGTHAFKRDGSFSTSQIGDLKTYVDRAPRSNVAQTFTGAEQRQIKANAGAFGTGYSVISQTTVLAASAIGGVFTLSGTAFAVTLPVMKIGNSIKLYNSSAYVKTINISGGGQLNNSGSAGAAYALQPYTSAVFECVDETSGHVVVFDVPSIYGTLSANFTQAFTATQSAQLLSNLGLNNSGVTALKNRVLNGNFRWNKWGRYGGSWGGNTILYDRWRTGAAGATVNFSASGGYDTTATIQSGTLLQIVEGSIYNQEGGTYVLSWQGNALGRVYVNGQNPAYAASPVIITGVAQGANIAVEFGVGTIGLVQLEPGTIPTKFERRDEYRALLRYLEKSYEYGVPPATPTSFIQGYYGVAINGADLNNFGMVKFLEEKGGLPTVSTYAPSTGSPNWYDISAGNLNGTARVQETNPMGFRLWNSDQSWTVNHVVATCWVAWWEPSL